MKSKTAFRRHLALTTILTVAPFLGYGRQAYAGCDPTGPSAFLCSGDSSVNTATIDIAADDADVATAPGFAVDAPDGNGISITGDGDLKFTDANRSTIAAYDIGLNVRSGEYGEEPVTGSVTIVTNGDITGGNRGIDARNYNSGDVAITVEGTVTALAGTGIRAMNSSAGENLTIVTSVGSEVFGKMNDDYVGGNGISARNYGRGDVDITVNGDVTSEYYHGIYAYNSYNSSGDLKITVGAESTVVADYNGIDAGNYGTGNLDIAVDGKVVSEYGLAGVVAFNRDEGGDLTIATGAGSVITGQNRGIMAKQYGHGDLEIVASGEVTGSEFGSGIYSYNTGAGETRITIGATGLAQGARAGIEAGSSDDQAIAIVNNGTIRNIDGLTTSWAIEIDRGPTTISNNSLILGTIQFDEEVGSGDIVNNNGTWNFARGTSTFGSGEDTLNNRGMLIAAADVESDETTTIDALEIVNNAGAISLSDGQVGDTLEISGDVRFNGTGGSLVVDAELAEGGTSDMLVIDGTVSGVTRVSVKAIGAIRSNTEGIAVVQVNGEPSDGEFKLDAGSRNTGFFAWDMRLDDSEGTIFEIYSTGLGNGAYEFAAGITATQDVWYQSVGTLLQRQADLRATIAGTQVTPVADFAEAVAPTAAGKAMPGFWFKALGAYLKRDVEEDGLDLDRTQTVYGGLAGLDVGMDLAGPGETMLFGLFGGYLVSDLEFKSTNTKWDYEGLSVGAYATYLNEAFYADLTVKADFLSIDIDADDLAPGAGEADTQGLNIGGQLDAGYKIGLDHGLFVEPQASLALLHTEIDDVDEILGGAVEFDNETSVRGRLGARLGHEFTDSNALVYASDVTGSVWQEFNGSNNTTIFAPDFAVTGVSDDTVATFGDVSVGFSVASPEGWSSFLRGSWQFAEDFDALSANAGLRYAW